MDPSDPQNVPTSPPPAEPGPTPVVVAATPVGAAELSPAACAARLADLFPAVFGRGGPRPLKLRIQADLQLRAPGVFTRKVLSAFLHRHTTSTAYLRARARATHRADHDGLPPGEVADEHRQAALAELERRRSISEARRAAERGAHREAQEAARREHEAQHAARGARAALLRAYETTTLTRANFCALKAVPDVELDALLAQARLERDQLAQAPRAVDRPPVRPPHIDPPPHRRRHAASKPPR